MKGSILYLPQHTLYFTVRRHLISTQVSAYVHLILLTICIIGIFLTCDMYLVSMQFHRPDCIKLLYSISLVEVNYFVNVIVIEYVCDCLYM